MPMKMIQGDAVWKAGASWDTGPPLNTGSQVVIVMVNQAYNNATLFTGDVVTAGIVSGFDPTAVNATVVGNVRAPQTIGVVGGQTNMPGTGGAIPFQIAPSFSVVGFTNNASPTLNGFPAGLPLATWSGLSVSGPNIPTGAYIISVTPGSSATMNVNAMAGGSAGMVFGPRAGSIGPGYLNGAFPIGDLVPIVIAGVAYVNIGANTVAAGDTLATSTVVRQAATSTATIGTSVGIALEPNTAGIPNGDNSGTLIRVWLTRF